MKKDNYLIFAHFHSSGLIRNDILKFLIEGNSFFKKIIFVSTNLKISERKKFPKSVKIIIRKNIGYDFYSYKWGFEYYLKELRNNFNNENLFFLNSSVLFVEKENKS